MASKRKKESVTRAAAKAARGKPGRGKSKYALKQKVANRPGSPFRTT